MRIVEDIVNKQGGVKGRPIQFVFYDDQTNPQLSVQLTNQILAKKPPFMMGSMLSAMCRAMLPLFNNGPELYCLTPDISTRDLIFGTIRYLRERGWKRIARLTTTDASQMKQYAAFMPKNVYFQACGYSADEARTAAGYAKVKVYEAAMKANGIYTDFQSGISGDPAMIMVDALRTLGTDATAEQFRNYLNNLHDYAGISGIYDFRKDPHGITIDDMIMMRWDTDKNVWVKASKFGAHPL